MIFTSESVGEGHPDKLCDQISDAVLDEALAQDPNSRVACEVYASTGMLVIGGEITTKATLDYEEIARGVLRRVGYTNAEYGIGADTCAVLVTVKRQSPDIAMGVDRLGAGDQGLMFGYACRDTAELMPAPIQFSHQIMRRASEYRRTKEGGYLRPDGKCQVTVEYRDGKPVWIDTIVLSHQTEDLDIEFIRQDLENQVIRKALPAGMISPSTKFYINPTGRFVVGGPHGDVGLTGRKIIVDTYGGMGRHGGGAFSGKDPTKVDRSGAYAARQIAKTVVAAGLSDRCEVQVAYAIGVDHPVSLMVDTFGTGTAEDEFIAEEIVKLFDLTPAGIISRLGLRRPIYLETASYGHFGRSQFPWEDTSMAEKLKAAVYEN